MNEIENHSLIKKYYRVAELNFCVELEARDLYALRSFESFEIAPTSDIILHLKPAQKLEEKEVEHQLENSDESGYSRCTRFKDGTFRLETTFEKGNPIITCIQANDDFSCVEYRLRKNVILRQIGLASAVHIAFPLAAVKHGVLAIHASAVLYGDRAYAFTAVSGTGKSTHTSLWIKNIDGATLLNDDNPIIRVIDGKPYLFGSPWSGKTPCYKNTHARLGAITIVKRAKENKVNRLDPVESFMTIQNNVNNIRFEHDIDTFVCDSIQAIVETTPCYELYCLPNDDAAKVCFESLVLNNK